MTKNIETLWQEMEDELREKDTTGRPQKIVMISPWTLKVHALDERETQLDLVRETPVDKEDFDESSLPPELLALVKENESASFYPNFVEAEGDGETLEEYLNSKVFADAKSVTIAPDPADVEGFAAYLKHYTAALEAEKAAVAVMK